MLKKIIATVVLSLSMLIGYANPGVDNSPVEAPSQQQTLPAGQTVMEVTNANSTEVNTVEESGLARKMSQAEKNKNAKENDSYGIAITIIAMTIVLCALIILSLLFMVFGKFSEKVLSGKKKKAIGASKSSTEDIVHDVDSGESIAAIAMALAEHFQEGHDIEDTILTIRRMRKAYSPWSSKLYNMTQLPDVKHNPASHTAFNR